MADLASIRAEIDQHLDVFEHLGRDELAVVLVIVQRIAMGRRAYGPLDVSDGRRWDIEAGEEFVDAGVYGAAEIVRAARVAKSLDEFVPMDDHGFPEITAETIGEAVERAIGETT